MAVYVEKHPFSLRAEFRAWGIRVPGFQGFRFGVIGVSLGL